MRTTLSILKLELKSLYYSPISWFTLAIFSLHSGYIFNQLLSQAVSQQELFGGGMELTRTLFNSSQGIYRELIKILFLYIPLITMGIFSKEYGKGTYKLLFSSPIKIRAIILGKYLSILSFFVFLLFSLIPILWLSIQKIPHLDLGLICSGMLGLFLLFAMYAAIGLFISSTTRYSILSAIITLAVLYLFNAIGDWGKFSPIFRDITFGLSTRGRTESIIEGLLCSDDIAYFLIITFTFLFVTALKLFFAQKRAPKFKQIALYGVCILVCVSSLRISQIPKATVYYDATANKRNTLSKESIDILQQIEEPVTITTYVNMADYLNWIATPPAINVDKKMFRKYLRFKPNIDMNYVYYEAEPLRNSDYDSPYRLPTATTAKVFCEANKMDYNKLGKHWNITSINLEAEKNSFVRHLSCPKQQTSSILRVFNDMKTHPSENEIALAFKALNTPPVNVGFITDITNRKLSSSQEIGYGKLINEKTNRYAAINQGFSINPIAINETKEMPDSLSILITSDFRPKQTPSKTYSTIANYIQKGKNLLLLLGNDNTPLQDSLLSLVGVSNEREQLLFPQKEIDTKIIPSYTTTLWNEINPYSEANNCVMLPESTSLLYNLGTTFEAFPILQTEANSCISIKNAETTQQSIRKRIVQYPSYATALALERIHHDKKQRIIVVANADFLSNKELNTKREGYSSQNDSFFLEMLHWLSEGKAPLNIRRQIGKDNKIELSLKQINSLSFWLIYPLAIFFLLCFGFIFLKRSRH